MRFYFVLLPLLVLSQSLMTAIRARLYERVTVEEGDSVEREVVEGPQTVFHCTAICNSRDYCRGITISNSKKCVLLWNSTSASSEVSSSFVALWDTEAPSERGTPVFTPDNPLDPSSEAPSEGETPVYTPGDPLDGGIVATWRDCFNFCNDSHTRMYKMVWDKDFLLDLYKKYNLKIYIDGLREKGGNEFYDSDGNLVWPSAFEGKINEGNRSETGLTTSWGKLGDVYADSEFVNDPKVCLCIT